jgi:hypothetical protein
MPADIRKLFAGHTRKLVGKTIIKITDRLLPDRPDLLLQHSFEFKQLLLKRFIAVGHFDIIFTGNGLLYDAA